VGPVAFLCDMGALDEATIREYIENQKWDEEGERFRIVTPTKPEAGYESGIPQAGSAANGPSVSKKSTGFGR
jgi:hypothetical protein